LGSARRASCPLGAASMWTRRTLRFKKFRGELARQVSPRGEGEQHEGPVWMPPPRLELGEDEARVFASLRASALRTPPPAPRRPWGRPPPLRSVVARRQLECMAETRLE
jgi:hypothetical protein